MAKKKALKLTVAQKRALAKIERLKIDPNKVREWFTFILELIAMFKGLK